MSTTKKAAAKKTTGTKTGRKKTAATKKPVVTKATETKKQDGVKEDAATKELDTTTVDESTTDAVEAQAALEELTASAASEEDQGDGADSGDLVNDTDSGIVDSVDGNTPDDDESSEEEEEEEELPALDKYDDILEYLETPGIESGTKLEVLAKHATLPIRSMVGALLAHATDLAPGMVEQEPKIVIGRIYTVYSIIKAAITEPDDTVFRIKMDIINLMFLEHGGPGEAFAADKLVRYDYIWQWGEAALKTYQVLVTIISDLASRETREDNLAKLDINSEFARTGLTVSQDNIDRFIRYYK